MIKLREYKKSDTDRLVQLANNENVSRYLVDSFPYPYTRKDAEWWIDIGCKKNGAITRVIVYQEEFVGGIGIQPKIGWKSHLAEIGYWLGEEYWGRGIGTEALGIMTHLALSAGKYKKLFAPVLGPNRASMEVLEKNGYILEGILKQEVFKGGQYYDICHYAKIFS